MDINIEKLRYLFGFMEEYLCDSINEVLNDSISDPHFSAVAVNNMIKCYIDIEEQLGTLLPYKDVKTFFDFYAFSHKEYNAFEECRKRESQYYKGIQF